MARKPRREASLKAYKRDHPGRVEIKGIPGHPRLRQLAKLLDALSVQYTVMPSREDSRVILILDDLTLQDPSEDQVLKLFPKPPIIREGYDLAIIGGGWSGLTAARTAAAHGLDVILLEEHTLLHHAHPSYELVERMRENLTREGIRFTEGARVKRLKPAGRLWEVSTDGAVYRARSIILAIGGVQPGEELPGSRLKGVFWHLPARVQQGEDCVFILHTPTAYELAIPLLTHCTKPIILDPENTLLQLSHAHVKLLEEQGARVYPYARLISLLGDDELEAVRFTSSEKKYHLPAKRLISLQPVVSDTHWLKPLGIVNEDGMIIHTQGETSLRGVYVAGRAAERYALSSEARKAEGGSMALRAVTYVRETYGDLPRGE